MQTTDLAVLMVWWVNLSPLNRMVVDLDTFCSIDRRKMCGFRMCRWFETWNIKKTTNNCNKNKLTIKWNNNKKSQLNTVFVNAINRCSVRLQWLLHVCRNVKQKRLRLHECCCCRRCRRCLCFVSFCFSGFCVVQKSLHLAQRESSIQPQPIVLCVINAPSWSKLKSIYLKSSNFYTPKIVPIVLDSFHMCVAACVWVSY